MPSTSTHHDVIVAGAGPVGLFLACELRLGGCSVLVLEKAHDPHSPLKGPPFGLRGLTTPSCESLDQRGLLDALRGQAASGDTPGAHWLRQRREPGGHFAGIPFFKDQVAVARWTFRVGEPKTLATDIATVERVLAERAQALGVELRRGRALEGLEALEDRVLVQSGGRRLSCGWLVGCDGAHSLVRKAAGFQFCGTDPEFTGYSVQVGLSDPDALAPGRHYTSGGMYVFTPPDVIAMVEFDGGAFHRTQPITREHVEAVLRRISGAEVQVCALVQAATWTDRAFQASAYKKGRVLLAGDAAHIHAPLGGQGLNLGLGDAMNLGWKLAAEVRGDAAPGLLDSYETERRPVAAQILDWSRAQVALIRPSRSSRALEAIVRDLVGTGDGATYFAERVWGVGLRYNLGEPHPLAGRPAPDFELSDGTRLHTRLRTGRGLLLEFKGVLPPRALAPSQPRRPEHLRADAKEGLGLGALLVRPDGVVAWACNAGESPAGVEAAIGRWYGPPG